MADVTVVAADFRPLPGAEIIRLVAAETLAPGKAVYIDGNGKAALADADVAASAQVAGVVVGCPNGGVTAAAGDTVDVCVAGMVTGFTGLTPGGLLYASTTAGAMADARPAGSSGDYVWIVGICVAATNVLIHTFTDSFAAA
jgi:hypothetical protein